MAKKKNRKVIEKGSGIDMNLYIDSLPIDDRCLGCKKVFTFVIPGTENMLTEEKCRAYVNPAAKWNDAPAVMMKVTTKIKGDFVTEMVPVTDTSCPLATHVERKSYGPVEHKRVGQQHRTKA